jgi:hypothetical protein
MERPQLLLAEYSEACQAARSHELNSRSALNFFLAFGGALLALVFTGPLSNAERVSLLFLGFAMGMFVLNTVFRHRAYYATYIHRAKEIEKELGMVLYTKAWEDLRVSRTFSNKHAIAGIVAVFSMFFLVAAFVFAFRGPQ